MLPVKRDATGATLRITLREGRNRQVRNMCDAIGHPVDHLKRVAIGPLRDPRLKTGYWRDLTPEEVARLQKASAPSPKPTARADQGHKGDKGHKARNAPRQP
jgi:16S rRNA U516 pseudouridylate synthase RsuA-like enzyme